MPGAQLDCDLWVNEYISPTDVYQHGVTRILAHERTPFQDMLIVETGGFGKGLVLDGKWQSCTGDEFMYHEPLVHPACVHHGSPRSVLVLGGGEGATVREALKWKTVERVVMVDLDRNVVEACKRHLPEMHRGAFDDPRTELVIENALTYLDRSENEWDVIISDLVDPIEEGPSFELFTKEYFEKCRRALKGDGVFVLQAGPTSTPELHRHVKLANTVAAVFPHIATYASHTNSYGASWGFVLGSASPIDTRPDPATVDALLADKTTDDLRMFDGTTLLGLLCVPKHIRAGIAAETEVFTLAAPPKFHGTGVAAGA